MKKSTLSKYGIYNKKGAILHVTLALFLIFVLMFSTISTIKYLNHQQQNLANLAFMRMDMEIAALLYYHNHQPKHHDAIYQYQHWITYWYRDDSLIIWFDGYYDYQLVIALDENGVPVSSKYIYE